MFVTNGMEVTERVQDGRFVKAKTIRAIFTLVSTAAMLMSGGTAHAQQSHAQTTAPAGSITDITVFQVKPERTDAFMAVMRANLAHSRTEEGNLGFDVYVGKNGKAVTVYVLERWSGAAAQKQHAQQPTLIALHKAFPTDLIGHPQSSAVSAVIP